MSQLVLREFFEDLPQPVAILDTHTMKHPTTHKEIVVDRAFLQRIADRNNKRIHDTGDEIPVCIGHTKEDDKETDGPPLVALARDFYVAPLYRSGRYGLWCKWRVRKGKKEKLIEYPRRSVELWLDDLSIDPIAILGATAPDRDLGLIRLSKDPSREHVTLNMQQYQNEKDNSMDPTQQAETELSLIRETPEWKFLQQLMQEIMAGEEGGEGEPPPEMPANANEPPIPDQPSEEPEEPEGPPDSGGPPVAKKEAEFDEPELPEKKAAMASGTNTAGPYQFSKKTQMSLQDEVAELRASNRALLVHFCRNSRAADLAKLQGEGIDLDVDEELAIVAPEDGEPMSDAQYVNYRERIVKRYSRTPVGAHRVIPAAGQRPVTSQEAAKEAVRRCQMKRKFNEGDYEEELASVLKGE
jgi:hypothetical protein